MSSPSFNDDLVVLPISLFAQIHVKSTRVVSMPPIRLFEEQPEEYQDSVLSTSEHIVSVEAYILSMWTRFCTASVAMD